MTATSFEREYLSRISNHYRDAERFVVSFRERLLAEVSLCQSSTSGSRQHRRIQRDLQACCQRISKLALDEARTALIATGAERAWFAECKFDGQASEFPTLSDHSWPIPRVLRITAGIALPAMLVSTTAMLGISAAIPSRYHVVGSAMISALVAAAGACLLICAGTTVAPKGPIVLLRRAFFTRPTDWDSNFVQSYTNAATAAFRLALLTDIHNVAARQAARAVQPEARDSLREVKIWLAKRWSERDNRAGLLEELADVISYVPDEQNGELKKGVTIWLDDMKHAYRRNGNIKVGDPVRITRSPIYENGKVIEPGHVWKELTDQN